MSRLSLEALELLDLIAETGSFARAAERLGKAPSAVSYAVRQCEDALDVLIFDRRGHRARLTPAGELLLSEGRALLADAERLTAMVREVERGWEAEFRIVLDAILPWSWFVPHLEAWDRAACPSTLRIMGEALTGSWDALSEGRADFVIGASGEPPPGLNAASQPLFAVDFVFAVAPTHRLARLGRPLRASDLAQERAIVVADSARRLPRRSSGLILGQPTLTVPTMADKLDLQRRGLGCGYLARWLAAPLLARGELVALEVEDGKPPIDLVCAWRRGRRLPGGGKALAWWRGQLQDARPPRA